MFKTEGAAAGLCGGSRTAWEGWRSMYEKMDFEDSSDLPDPDGGCDAGRLRAASGERDAGESERGGRRQMKAAGQIF